jgi:cell division septation protein DedD
VARRSEGRGGEAGWLASLLGAVVLIVGGFGLGLVAGLVTEEPELVVGHLAGRGEQVPWQPEAETKTGAEAQQPLPVEIAGAQAPNIEAIERLPVRTQDAGRWVPAEAVPPRDLPAVAAAPEVMIRQQERAQLEAVAALRPAPRAPLVASDRVGFAVQVGAFTDAKAADRVYQRLRGKGFDVYIIPASKAGDGRSRVRVGTVASKADAQALASRLKQEERLPTWVLSEGGS